MNPTEHNDTDLYRAPAADVVVQHGEFDESSMFTPAGRAGRLRYFGYAMVFAFLASLVMGILSGIFAAIGGSSNTGFTAAGIIPMVAYLAISAMTIIFMIKRLHDLNWTGWISLLSVVPLVNVLLAVILIFVPGTPGPNKYGPPPRPENSVVAIVVVTLFLVAFIGIIAAIAIPAYNDFVNRAQQVQQTP